MIARKEYEAAVRKALRRSPVVMLLGPRQCGKTTLARQLLHAEAPTFFDLEDPAEARALASPMTALQGLGGLVVLDEAQRQPGLFPVLRVLADRPRNKARFLVLGSASPELGRQAAESLAGRVEVIDVRGFSLGEVGAAAMDKLWSRGGFPRAFLARSDADSLSWRKQFIRTFLERDLAALGFGMSPRIMERFWSMIAHHHGQIWNASQVAASLGVAPNTASSYLDALEQTFMIRRLQPWFTNLGKRVVKSPKIYLRDSGVLHALLGLGSSKALLTHPKLGASWEGFVLEEVLAHFRPQQAWFYGVHAGSELDLFFTHKGRALGFEIKREDAPRMTKSMHVALADLGLQKLYVIYPGSRRYSLAPKVECVPLGMLLDL
ncbi:MAG: ATP-binding protein [Flavobacteriales bacterium]|nr:ATP-binding protein [Flavobacteriales bacterium]MBK7942774.1 ATP-binding protein [Flavobacteriales bacterium]MBK8949577.1 ATP-binding protein [Flavobacteriales bacterium]MBK9698826.1 ATP-binding protein [Flavobacteriales bacterium]